MALSDRPALDFCRHCGAAKRRKLGSCHICSQDVCEACGNFQDTTQHGRVAMHHHCMKEEPEAASSAFKFIKFVGHTG